MAKAPDNNTPEGPSKSEEVFLREVDDAVREANLQDFVQRYGIAIGAVVLVALLALAGWLFYDYRQDQSAGVRSEEYIAAIDNLKAGNVDAAEKELDPLTSADEDGYRAAALLLKAAIASEKSDAASAGKAYQQVLDDADLPQPFRDLALVRKTALEYDTLKPDVIVSRLKPLAVPDNPWFASAGEMVAIAYINMGKKDLAGPLFAQLGKDENVPPTVRSRAVQMAGVMGIDAVAEQKTDAEGAAQGATAGEEGTQP